MANLIYKSGQGYWTRLLTAIGAGILVIWGASWLSTELEGLGSSVTVINREAQQASRHIAAWGGARGYPIANIGPIASVSQKAGATPAETEFVLTDDYGQSYSLKPAQLAEAVNFPIANVTLNQSDLISRTPDSVTMDATGSLAIRLPATFAHTNKLYIRAVTVAVVIIGFGLLVFWLLNKPRIVDFMIATESEMRKVNWPTRREVVGMTIVVISGTLIMALMLFTFDLFFSYFFQEIGILQTA